MRIYGRELLAVCRHPDKFADHRHCYRGDIMFLVCHVTACLKGLVLSVRVTTLLFLVAIGLVHVEI